MSSSQRIALLVFLGAVAAALYAMLGPREGEAPAAHSPEAAMERPTGGPDPRPTGERSGSPTRAAATPPADRDAPTARPAPRAFDSAIDPADAPFVDAFGEPSPELVRAAIEAVVVDVFVDRTLSPAELDRAAKALVDLRAARAELDGLPMEPAHAERRRALVEALGQASETFREVTRLSPAEFTTRAAEATSAPAVDGDPGGGIGIDRDVDPGYVPEDDFLPPRGAAPEPVR